MGLITSIEYLQPAIQEKIKRGIQEQIIGRALLEKELNPDTYLNYLNSEIAKASESISKLLDESKREGADLDIISKIIVWNKERKTALLRLKDLVSQEPATGLELPSEIDTEQARKYFARAVETGLMSEQYLWRSTQAQLGYFCSKVFEQPRPITILEGFFNVKNLAASITQASYEHKRADVKKWRAELDSTIFFD